MPQIGWFELLIIVVIAILVIGPKDFPIVLICAMGRNAGLAGEKLQKHGYSETHVLKGGLATWQQEGLPLVKV